MTADQQPLWHEDIYDALRYLCDALEDDHGRRGIKATACWLFGETKTPQRARQYLLHALDANRSETLDPHLVVRLLLRGSQQGVHVAKHYLDDATGYSRSKPVTPDDQRSELQRDYIAAVGALEKATRRMAALTREAL